MTEPTVPTPLAARPTVSADPGTFDPRRAVAGPVDALPFGRVIRSGDRGHRSFGPVEPPYVADEDQSDEVVIVHELLAAHRSMVIGALQANPRVDIEGAFQVHALLCRILTHWDDFSAPEQREVLSVVHYVVDADDDQPDLSSADGFSDDLHRVRRLIEFLEFTW